MGACIAIKPDAHSPATYETNMAAGTDKCSGNLDDLTKHRGL